MHATYPAKCAYVEPNSGRVVSPWVEVARGDVTEDDTSALRAALQGCTQVVVGP
jgi:hypothetical protein